MAWKLLACRDLYEHRLLLVATEDDEPNNYHAMPGPEKRDLYALHRRPGTLKDP